MLQNSGRSASTECEHLLQELKDTLKLTDMLMAHGYLSHLKVACSAIKVEMQILDFSKFWKLVMDIFLCGLFMYTGHKQDPALHSYKKKITQGGQIIKQTAILTWSSNEPKQSYDN